MSNQGQNQDDKLLRKREVAEKLACSPRTVDRMVSVGKLTPIRVLGAIRFRLSQVLGIVNGGEL
jgi:predicted DNA-binding transcriptional regulator AlpA